MTHAAEFLYAVVGQDNDEPPLLKGFYFTDESESQLHGPFPSFVECYNARNAYYESLNG